MSRARAALSSHWPEYLIEAAGLGVAFHGKPALRDAADACIDHGDLTALLYAQGYRREDFAVTANE